MNDRAVPVMGERFEAASREKTVHGLALETSGLRGSVAAFDADRILEARELNPDQRSAQSLAPAIRDLLASVGWQPRDVRLVAVTVGPGSFTGLRIGVTTAKTFAYAVGAEVIAVDTLEVIASQAPPDTNSVKVALDAGRGQLFAAEFRRDEQGQLVQAAASAIVDADEWIAHLQAGDTLSGAALEKLAAKLPAGVACLDAAKRNPTAQRVAQLAWQKYAQGQRDDLLKLTPVYLRRSAAEEKWDARHGAS